jgi:two-component system, cell cycle sensor histidine kinase and response regulator CckA
MKPGTTESLYGNGELILVIDDEPNTLLMTRAILEERNYRVVCANGGMEALAMFADFSEQMSNVRLVLTDAVLSDMKGVALIREIKKLEKDTLFIASIGQGRARPGLGASGVGYHEFCGQTLRSTKAAQDIAPSSGTLACALATLKIGKDFAPSR